MIIKVKDTDITFSTPGDAEQAKIGDIIIVTNTFIVSKVAEEKEVDLVATPLGTSTNGFHLEDVLNNVFGLKDIFEDVS